jgi:hypothetical protein
VGVWVGVGVGVWVGEQNSGSTKNSGIEFILATSKELQLATLSVLLPFVYTLLCSCPCISD